MCVGMDHEARSISDHVASHLVAVRAVQAGFRRNRPMPSEQIRKGREAAREVVDLLNQHPDVARTPEEMEELTSFLADSRVLLTCA